jgi:eukaryotic-like serine/threonine-protein kinase
MTQKGRLSPEDERLALDIFLEAVGLDPRSRFGYLDNVCGADTNVRSKVESLFQEAEQDRLTGSTLTIKGFRPGERIGEHARFRVVRRIGSGGMGDVYEAEDIALDKRIAIKTIRPQVGERPEMRARFKREVQIAQEITHPNVCRIYDLEHHWIRTPEGQDGAALFMTMEFLGDAVPLPTLLRERGPMSVKDVLRIGRQIAAGLQALHSAGYLHRDIKPGNIMISDFEQNQPCRAVITDLGLARRIWEGRTIPAPGFQPTGLSGTPEYMAPEQISGGALTPAADIYSLGVVLYQMLTGQVPSRDHPFVESNKVPPALAGILRTCLAPNPEDRFARMDQLLAALDRAQAEASGTTSRKHFFTWPRLLTAGAALMLALCLAALVYFRSDRPEIIQPERLTAFAGEEAFPTLSPDGSYVAFSWTGDRGDNQDIYMNMTGRGSTRPVRLTSDPARDFSPAFSPDGRQIAFLRSMGADEAELMVRPAWEGPQESRLAHLYMNTGHLLAPGVASIFHREPPGPYVAWFRSGSQLAVSMKERPSARTSIWAISADSDAKEQMTHPPGPGESDSSPAVSPDGRTLAFTRTVAPAISDIYLLGLSSKSRPSGRERRLTFLQSQIHGLAWAPDGRSLIFAAGTGAGALWRVRISGSRPEALSFGEDAHDLTISAKSHMLVYSRVSYDRDIVRVALLDADRRGGETYRKLAPSTRIEYNPKYSPDGKSIAFESDRSGFEEIWVSGADGSNPFPITQFKGPPAGSPRWSPDGQEIAFDCSEGGAWDIYVSPRDGGQSTRVTDHRGNNVVPSWSHDGAWIYFASDRTGRYEIWKVPATGGKVSQVTQNGGFVAFESPAGGTLYYTKADQESSLWQMPAGGGAETELPVSVYERNFFVTAAGLYFIPVPTSGAATVKFYDSARRSVRDIATTQGPVFEGISVSPDNRYLLYSQTSPDLAGADLMLVHHFQ